MSTNGSTTSVRPEKFDAYADSYRKLHQQSIAASGEPPEYFARHKLGCVERLVRREGLGGSILDYGCGVGNLTELLAGRFARVAGYDPSRESLERARARAPRAQFYEDPAAIPPDTYDIAVMAGVLHHVPVKERLAVLARAIRALKPGSGRLVVFEHNPLNPLTQKAVRDCPFDDDAVLLWPGEAKKLLEQAGLLDLRRDFVVFFPRALAGLRGVEPWLAWLPAGAQMMLVGRRPG